MSDCYWNPTTGGVWTSAEIRRFGVQPRLALRIARQGCEKTLYATADHRWLVEQGDRSKQWREVITQQLVEGEKLVSVGEDEGLQTRPAPCWTVVSVEPTNRMEEVYCAVVPGTHCFVLEDNILTGNCGGRCIKQGVREWLRLRYHFASAL